MKKNYHLITFISSIFIGLLAFTTPVLAESTPDGETPAEEGVCDSLSADGVSKGLYGLCVAYCEAHDAHLDSYTIEDLGELSTPNQKILENYRKKMRPGDPGMPCVASGPSCPCWAGATAILDTVAERETSEGLSLPFWITVNFDSRTDLYFRSEPKFSVAEPQYGIDFIAVNFDGGMVCVDNLIQDGTFISTNFNFLIGPDAPTAYANCSAILEEAGSVVGVQSPFPDGVNTNF